MKIVVGETKKARNFGRSGGGMVQRKGGPAEGGKAEGGPAGQSCEGGRWKGGLGEEGLWEGGLGTGGLGKGGPGEGVSCVLWGGEEGSGQSQQWPDTEMAQNIKTLILVNLAKNVCLAKVRFGQKWIGQTWIGQNWIGQNWPNHQPLTTKIGQKWIGQSRP